jgi:hypothetical protein
MVIIFLTIFTAALAWAPPVKASSITIQGTGTLYFVSGTVAAPAILAAPGATILLTQVLDGAPPYTLYTGTLTYTLPPSTVLTTVEISAIRGPDEREFFHIVGTITAADTTSSATQVVAEGNLGAFGDIGTLQKGLGIRGYILDGTATSFQGAFFKSPQ